MIDFNPEIYRRLDAYNVIVKLAALSGAGPDQARSFADLIVRQILNAASDAPARDNQL